MLSFILSPSQISYIFFSEMTFLSLLCFSSTSAMVELSVSVGSSTSSSLTSVSSPSLSCTLSHFPQLNQLCSYNKVHNLHITPSQLGMCHPGILLCLFCLHFQYLFSSPYLSSGSSGHSYITFFKISRLFSISF